MKSNGSKKLEAIPINNSLIKENLVNTLPDFDVDHISGFNYLFIVALTIFNQMPLEP